MKLSTLPANRMLFEPQRIDFRDTLFPVIVSIYSAAVYASSGGSIGDTAAGAKQLIAVTYFQIKKEKSEGRKGRS
jgi:hypothetical protein